MTQEDAQRAITTSAVVVFAVYAYRRLFEGQTGKQARHVADGKGSAKQLAGAAGVPPLSHFIVGYGFAFLVISALGQASPELGAGMAALLATSTVLANGAQVFGNIGTQTAQPQPASGSPSTFQTITGGPPGPLGPAGLR